MKTILMAAMVTGILVGSTRAADTPAPRIQFDQLVYDFGTTSDVQHVSGVFTFQNTGDADLKLLKPVTSCGCTSAGAKPDVLKPGEKGELQFTLNVGHLRGHMEKTITVPCNDPVRPATVLTLKVDLKTIYVIDPERIQLGDLRQGGSTNLVVTVKRIDEKPLVIGKLLPSSNAIKAEVDEAHRPDAQTARVLLQFTADTPRRFYDTVQIVGDETDKTIGHVYLYGRVLGDVSLSPEVLFWGVNPQMWSSTPPENLILRRIRVTSNQSQPPLEIRDLVSTVKELGLEIQTVETGKVYDVVARLTSPPGQSEHGNITFNTNLPNQPVVIVPVTINVLAR